MAEALFNASGLGLPIVMTDRQPCHRRADQHLERPLRRDVEARLGWIQLYAESNQEAVDLHVQAFRIAEALSLPVMVCMDGFVLTHALRAGRAAVAGSRSTAFLPPFAPRQVLDPADPVTIGAMVGPEAFMEVRYLMHAKQRLALDAIPRDRRPTSPPPSDASPAGSCAATGSRTPRPSSSRSARCSARSRTSSTSCATAASGSARCDPLLPPVSAGRGACGAGRRRRVVVVEKAFAAGVGGIVGQNVRLALAGLPSTVRDVIAGLGGRPVTSASLERVLDDAIAGRLGPLTFLDLRDATSSSASSRGCAGHAVRAAAENMLRDIGLVAAGRV